MARKKLSEFKTKQILYSFLKRDYSGVSINATLELAPQLEALDAEKRYVLKVDQGIKQRKKKGLVYFDVTQENAIEKIQSLGEKGFSQFIMEEFLEHEGFSEKYLAVERVREGKRLSYSTSGGVDIEENRESVKSVIIQSHDEAIEVAERLGLTREMFDALLAAFDDYYFSFLEINPLITQDDTYFFLDAACEVDSAAEFFVNDTWGKEDFREAVAREKTDEERAIEELKENSPSSFSFEMLNNNGSLFLLLSGGGASLVTADEIYLQGKGEMLANYGEYSGNPNQEETYIYTKNLLSALLHSKASKKALILSGGVANFTDIRITFKGIIRALSEVADELRSQDVKVFARRGGPNQDEGLTMMREFLEREQLIGSVNGPEMVLTDIVKPAIEHVS